MIFLDTKNSTHYLPRLPRPQANAQYNLPNSPLTLTLTHTLSLSGLENLTLQRWVGEPTTVMISSLRAPAKDRVGYSTRRTVNSYLWSSDSYWLSLGLSWLLPRPGL